MTRAANRSRLDSGLPTARGTLGESAIPIVKGIADTLNAELLHQTPVITVLASSLHARTYGAIDVLLPGVIAFNIIGSALMLAAGVFSTYKATGVLRRLKATGISPGIFVFSHATSSFLHGMAQTLAIIVLAIALFRFHLDLVALLVVTALGYLVFLAMGFAISGWVRDPQRATAISQAIALPLIFIALLSASLPASIAAVAKYLPVSFVTDALRQLGEGASIVSVTGDLALADGLGSRLAARCQPELSMGIEVTDRDPPASGPREPLLGRIAIRAREPHRNGSCSWRRPSGVGSPLCRCGSQAASMGNAQV